MVTNVFRLGPWVKLQMSEYEELLNMDGADKRWWDYRALFRKYTSVGFMVALQPLTLL